MHGEDATNLPVHVKLALASISKALGKKALLPENIAPLSAQFRDCIAAHIVRLEHKPRPPKGSRPRLKATYTISIYGPRFDGRWNFSPGELEILLRSPEANVTLPDTPSRKRPPRKRSLLSLLARLIKKTGEIR